MTPENVVLLFPIPKRWGAGSSENLDFLYEGLGKERGDEEEEEEGGR